MPAVNSMTGGRALLLCTNAENCVYQTAHGLQCCGVKIGDPPATGPQRRSQRKHGEATPPLTPLHNLSDGPGCSAMLAHKRATSTDPRANENGLAEGSKLSRTSVGLKSSASIRDKISQWEGKQEAPPAPLPPCPLTTTKELDIRRKKDTKTTEIQRGESKRLVSWERHDSGKENAGKLGDWRPTSAGGPAREREGLPERGNRGKLAETLQDKRTVSTHIKKLERAMKESPGKPAMLLPGSCFSPSSKEQPDEGQDRPAEPIFGTLDMVQPAGRRGRDLENVYTEPGTPSINPLPKPLRTFQHHTRDPTPNPAPHLAKSRRNLPPLPSIPHPPLPACPPPGVNRRAWADRARDSSNRKSYEFEDVLQLSTEGCRGRWPQLSRTLSEENVYEDILDPPSKENPYEDIELESSCPANKLPLPSAPDTPAKIPSKPGFCRHSSERRSFRLLDLRKASREGGIASPSRISPPSTPSSPDDTPCLSGDPCSRRRRRIPKLVLKINSIFEARRGRKPMKRVSQSAESSSGRVTDENSESESDTEEKLEAHSQRLVSVQSMLRQTGRHRSLEQDLQERRLFEYFLVVALHKAKAGSPYLPEVTQQFPLKLERNFKFLRETEDQLKVIPQFCFPDARDWAPVESFASETFSFVLTGEDGSRRFGYCRRLLPSGKGRRLPEVYCIVSRLGCFDLFSKVLDEVEKRRAISPALVQPFMRGIMEAPFPAPGRTVSVRTFLPGSGTEVLELCRPSDSRLEHVDFECLFSSLSLRLLLRVFTSLLLEHRVIFTADKLSAATLHDGQHTYIPVLPPSMMDIVCTPTPFIVGLLSSCLPRLAELPVEQVLVVDLGSSRFLTQLDDEDSILPHKLQAALEQVLERRRELACERGDAPSDSSSLSAVVSDSRDSSSPREAFRKAVSSRSLRRFLELFMETQMFTAFIQERALRRQGLRGLFEVRAQDYLDSLPGSEHRGVNKFLKGLGNKMKFLSKK
ncbi:hypothetical protein MATL_G00263620 [Megalops atlanticus]|uniref:UDENN domain-containing protein n=1 Tax=Megalops atlanticus TaxID=7932 RepID=A0A9D3PAQ9_MEGAT|nr:hypothetical protein MATL_G00263620 [Megalops atlanticus]